MLLQVTHTYTRNLGKIPIGGKSFTLKFAPTFQLPTFRFPASANLDIELHSDCATQDSNVQDLDMRVDFEYKSEV